MINYVGILDGANDVWGMRIPDIAGCVGAGSSPDAAVADAVIALRDVASHNRHDSFELPGSRTLAQVMSSGDIAPGETTIMLPLLLDAGRTVRANLMFDAALLEAIDAAARTRGLTSSAFVASAGRDKILALA